MTLNIINVYQVGRFSYLRLFANFGGDLRPFGGFLRSRTFLNFCVCEHKVVVIELNCSFSN